MPAAPSMPAPTPAFFALPVTSTCASRSSSRTSRDTSWDSRETSSPVESGSPVDQLAGLGWCATGVVVVAHGSAPAVRTGRGRRTRRSRRGRADVGSTAGPVAVGGRRGRDLLLDGLPRLSGLLLHDLLRLVGLLLHARVVPQLLRLLGDLVVALTARPRAEHVPGSEPDEERQLRRPSGPPDSRLPPSSRSLATALRRKPVAQAVPTTPKGMRPRVRKLRRSHLPSRFYARRLRVEEG